MEARIENLELIQDMVNRLASDSFRTKSRSVDSPSRVALGRVVTFTDVQQLDAVPNSPDDGSTFRGCVLIRICRSRP